MVLPQQTHRLQAQLCVCVGGGQTLTELYLSPPTQGPCNVTCSGSAPQTVWRRWTAQQTPSLPSHLGPQPWPLLSLCSALK